jgi:predicted transcriptional regulator of viral defense system
MKLNELRRIQKVYFGYEELARALGISLDSARVAASRYVKQGLLIRIKRNLYMLREVWQASGKEEKFLIANMGQVPSYISLTTALDYYDITTQIQRNIYESISVHRTKEIWINDNLFNYTKISSKLYFGFIKTNGFFIAIPEKALLDAFYLTSMGRYAIDISAIDISKFNIQKLKKLSDDFPQKTKTYLRANGYLPTT